MRNAFANEVTKLGQENPKLVLLAGDIGNKLFDDFKDTSPARFRNCGVAEANMIGMAAGLAMSGLRPVVYTINSFLTTRCYEQIRVDLCYHNVPVILVGVGSGLGYASLGATHHSCEDLAMMRILPNMTVIAPADAWEVRGALRAALQCKGPVFIRIGKKGEPAVHQQSPDFKIGRTLPIRSGTDVALLGAGTVLPMVLKAADLLAKQGVSAEVVSFHTIKPLDQTFLTRAFSRFSLVATVEEHSVLGGLGGSVAEWLADQPRQKALFCRFGTGDYFLHEAGEEEHARTLHGLTVEKIVEQVLRRRAENVK